MLKCNSAVGEKTKKLNKVNFFVFRYPSYIDNFVLRVCDVDMRFT